MSKASTTQIIINGTLKTIELAKRCVFYTIENVNGNSCRTACYDINLSLADLKKGVRFHTIGADFETV